MLWFDVEIGYYTTDRAEMHVRIPLWFDVEIGYYTTFQAVELVHSSCDLM